MKKKFKIAILIFTLLFIVTCSALIAKAESSNIIKDALSPLKNIDLAGLYEEHSFFFDLVIYLVAFIGIAKFSLGSRFQGKGGNLMIISIGIILAVSLAVAEKSMNFSIKSFSPLAAIILILIVGMSFYQIIKATGLTFLGSGALSFILVYFVVRTTTPSVFAWIDNNFPLVHILFLVAIVFVVWDIIRKFTSHKTAATFSATPFKMFQSAPEEKLMEKSIEEGVNREIAVTEYQIKTIQDILRRLERGFTNEKEREYAAQFLESIRVKKIQEFNVVLRMENFIKKIEGITETQFKEMKIRYKGLPPQAKRQALNNLFIEEKKEHYIINMRKIIAFMENRHKYLLYNLNHTKEELTKNELNTAKNFLKTALKIELELDNYLRRIKGQDLAIEQLSKGLK